MQPFSLPGKISQRFFATVVAVFVLLAGVVPALHHHGEALADEAHCLESGAQAATHFETLELGHHELCSLCAKTLSSARLQRPLATFVDKLVAEHASEGRQILPPGPPGRHGASRAPPLV